MSTEKQFQSAYLRALRATAKETRTASGGARLTSSQKSSVRFSAEQKAEDEMLARHGRVTKSLVKGRPRGYIIAQDRSLSGWGSAKKRSIYAVAVNTPTEAEIVGENMELRGEMSRIRYSKELPALKRGEHLHVVDRSDASRFFEVAGFGPEDKWNGRKRSRREYEFSIKMGPAWKRGYQAGLGKPLPGTDVWKKGGERDRKEWKEGHAYGKALKAQS